MQMIQSIQKYLDETICGHYNHEMDSALRIDGTEIDTKVKRICW